MKVKFELDAVLAQHGGPTRTHWLLQHEASADSKAALTALATAAGELRAAARDGNAALVDQLLAGGAPLHVRCASALLNSFVGHLDTLSHTQKM